MLADAKQVKNLPGRPKRDPADSRWLAACSERGAVTACFVATPEFRIIRLHTRYRRDLTEERTREKQRAEKLLEDAQLTELRGRIAVSGGSARGRAARFPAYDQRRGWAAGSVVAEGAALRGG